ncbi:MAG TPA: hypothetical protein VMU50_19160 [Polyangia bacterium]|nr:hypothetical protein [Polyangia bacterium]
MASTVRSPPSSSPIARLVIAAGLAAFLGLHVTAAVLYRGGTFCDAAAPRYQIWGNYVCDLTQPRTPAGADNRPAAELATWAFAAIAFAFLPFWWRVGAWLPAGARRLVRIAGPVSAVGTFVVARLPSARWPWFHVSAVFAATIPGLVAAGISVVGLLRARRWSLGVPGAATLIFAAADAVGYARAVTAGSRCNPALPVLQKLAALALVIWMMAIALAHSASRRAR